jgi:hypothetical protein
MTDEFIPDLDGGVVATGISLTDLLPIEQGIGGTLITRPLEFELLSERLLKERYKILPSVATNNLTITIQDLAGSAPAADNLIPFRVGDTLYHLAAATSFTKNAGTNWCNLGGAELAGQATDLFLYAIGETGAAAGLKFGFSRIPYAQTMADFVNTTTDEKYIAGNWTNFVSTNAVRVIGRFRAQLSASASFNWSIAAQKVINYPIYETDWLSWAPVYAGFSANPTGAERYKVISDVCLIHRDVTTNGTSSLTTFTMTFPWKFANSAANAVWVGARDNGVEQSTPGHMQVTAGSNVGSM